MYLPLSIVDSYSWLIQSFLTMSWTISKDQWITSGQEGFYPHSVVYFAQHVLPSGLPFGIETPQSAYLETISVFIFDQLYRWGFSPCLGWLVLSQLLRVDVWVWQDSETFFSCLEDNGSGNRWSKWATVMTPKLWDWGWEKHLIRNGFWDRNGQWNRSYYQVWLQSCIKW